MPTPAARPRRFAATALAAGLRLSVLGGCTVGAEPATPGPLATLDIPATPTPLPTQRPTPTPVVTASPTPVLSPSPKPEPASDLASDLRINLPYKLVANGRNGALKATLSFDVAGSHIEAVMNGREIWLGGKLVGIALVMEMRGIEMTDEVFEAAANNNGRARATFSQVNGKRVAWVDTGDATVGMYLLHGRIIMVGGPQGDDSILEMLIAVINAN
jgi:hypothetical protein